MVNWSKEEVAAYQKQFTTSVLKQKGACRECDKSLPDGRTKYCCDECRVKYRRRQNSKGAKAERAHEHVSGGMMTLHKDAAPIDDGPCTINRCPDCGAVYDATTTCSGDKNRRQFTRREHNGDYDYFVCFCGHTYTRYK